MNQRVINAIYKYVEVLYYNNQKLIGLFGVDAIDGFDNGSKDMLNIIQDIPRLIPYKYNTRKRKLELIPEDGLLIYKSMNKLFLEYNKVLKNNRKCLIKIKKIRNKCEHLLHNVNLRSCYTDNNSWFRYSFRVKSSNYIIESAELISLFKDLNKLYDNLIKEMLEYSYKKKINHPFYTHLQKIKLLGFNKLYDSGLLYEIGKSIKGI